MVTDTLLESFPLSQYDASVAEVLNEIAGYQELEADWDAEGALPVSPEVSHLATWLVQMVALSAKHQKAAWQPPLVGPSADGGINLEWESAGRQLLVMIRPGHPHLAECIIHEAGSPPRRRIASVWEAIDQALWAISSG